MLSLNIALDPTIRFVGIDDSPEMLHMCRDNIKKANVTRPLDLINNDLNKTVEINNASVVILCLTLKFVRPVNRYKLLHSILRQLNPN